MKATPCPECKTQFPELLNHDNLEKDFILCPKCKAKIIVNFEKKEFEVWWFTKYGGEQFGFAAALIIGTITQDVILPKDKIYKSKTK